MDSNSVSGRSETGVYSGFTNDHEEINVDSGQDINDIIGEKLKELKITKDDVCSITFKYDKGGNVDVAQQETNPYSTVKMCATLKVLVGGRAKTLYFRQDVEVYCEKEKRASRCFVNMQLAIKRTDIMNAFRPSSRLMKMYNSTVFFWSGIDLWFKKIFSSKKRISLATSRVGALTTSEYCLSNSSLSSRVASTFSSSVLVKSSTGHDLRRIDIKKLDRIQRAAVCFDPGEADRDAYTAFAADALSEGSWKSSTTAILNTVLQEKKADLTPVVSNFVEAYGKYADRFQMSSKRKEFSKAFDEVKEIKAEQCVVVDLTVWMRGRGVHSMTGMVYKENDGTHTFYLCNTGYGINLWHPKKVSSDGAELFQGTLKISGIGNIGNIKRFLDKVGSKRIIPDMEPFYEDFVPLLGGTVERVDEERFWTTGQIGGSCSASSEMMLLKMLLPQKQFSDIENIVSKKALFRTYQRIASGWDKTYSAKVMALDIVKRLMRGNLSRKEEIPSDVEFVCNKLQQLQTSLPRRTLSKFKAIPKDLKRLPSAQIIDDDKRPQEIKFEDALDLTCYHMVLGNYERAYSWLSVASKISPDQSSAGKKRIKSIAVKFVELTSHDNSLEAINLRMGVIESLGKIDIKVTGYSDFSEETSNKYLQGGLAKQFPDSSWAKNSYHIDLGLVAEEERYATESFEITDPVKMLTEKINCRKEGDLRDSVKIVKHMIKNKIQFNDPDKLRKIFDQLAKACEIRVIPKPEKEYRIDPDEVNRKCGLAHIFFNLLKMHKEGNNSDIQKLCEKLDGSSVARSYRNSVKDYRKRHLAMYFQDYSWMDWASTASL